MSQETLGMAQLQLGFGFLVLGLYMGLDQLTIWAKMKPSYTWEEGLGMSLTLRLVG